MRVSFNAFYRNSISNLSEKQFELNKVASQISTGRRLDSASEDALIFAQIKNNEDRISGIETFLENDDLAERQLGTQDELLQSVSNTLNRVKELQVQGGNTIVGADSLRAIATEMRGQLDILVSIANHKNPNGDYFFSGDQSKTTPFTKNAQGKYTYNGDDGHINLEVAEGVSVEIKDSGFDVFANVSRGNGTFYVEDAGTPNTGTGILKAASVLDKTAYVIDTYTVTFSEPGGVLSYEVRDSGGGVVQAVTPYESGAAIEFRGLGINIEGTPAAGDDFDVIPAGGHTIFSAIENAIDAIESYNATDSGIANYDNKMFLALQEVDQSINHIINVRTRSGGPFKHRGNLERSESRH